MTAEERERMFAVCKLIQDEKDPDKFTQLLEELDGLLQQKKERIRSARSKTND